jgi:hypothetical protein
VVIKHQNGLYTYSAHLDEANVKVGQKVNQGDVVGWAGNTGYVNKQYGPNYHLHFAVRNTGPQDSDCWDLSCWLDPDNYLGTVQDVNPTPDPSEPEIPANLIAKIDKIIDLVKKIPGFENWGENWGKIREFIPYIPWVLAGLTLLSLLGLLWLIKPVIIWISQTNWGMKRYKNAELFWLALSIKVIGQGHPYWDQMAHFLIIAWCFFMLEQIIESLYRHFNYDPEIKKGGPGKKEWLRKIINMMFNLSMIVIILAYSWGYFLLGFDFDQILEVLSWFEKPDEAEPQPNPPNPNPTPDPNPPKPDPDPPGPVTVNFNCDFNAVKAGLGPVKVSCDENGLPEFPIRWWNGEYFTFRIPLEIWSATKAASSTPEQILGSIGIASSESTGFTNYLMENAYGALGVWQFLPATYSHWAPEGFKDPAYRTNIPVAAKAVRNMMEKGMKEIYLMEKGEYTSCFMGGDGCWTWNQHSAQADYAYRVLQALKVAAGVD